MQAMTLWILSTASVFAIGCSSSESSTSPDPRSQATTLARDDLPCTTDADCCVVFDTCMNDGYVVASKDKNNVTSLLASADKSRCTACIPPPTQVSCGPSGFCVGVKIECTSGFFSEGSKDHCGKLTLPTGCTEKKSGTVGPVTKTVLHCG